MDTLNIPQKYLSTSLKTTPSGRPTEHQFYKAIQKKPSIIHVASHGAFIEGSITTSAKGVDQLSKELDPMNRSLVAFSGAQSFWMGGKKSSSNLLKEDGLLTANELSIRNLENTSLLVLSACATGLGKPVGNEGVFGLQRGIKMAGVDHFLLSLWNVNDKSSREFMVSFYNHLFQKKYSLKKSYNAAVNEMKNKYQGLYFWTPFVLIQ